MATSLGQIGIFVVFIAVLMFRPTGLFGLRGVRTPHEPLPPRIVVLLLALATLPLLIHSDFWINFAIMALYFGLIGQAGTSWAAMAASSRSATRPSSASAPMPRACCRPGSGLDPWLCLIAAGLLAAVAGTFVGAFELPFRTTRFLLRAGNASLR